MIPKNLCLCRVLRLRQYCVIWLTRSFHVITTASVCQKLHHIFSKLIRFHFSILCLSQSWIEVFWRGSSGGATGRCWRAFFISQPFIWFLGLIFLFSVAVASCINFIHQCLLISNRSQQSSWGKNYVEHLIWIVAIWQHSARCRGSNFWLILGPHSNIKILKINFGLLGCWPVVWAILTCQTCHLWPEMWILDVSKWNLGCDDLKSRRCWPAQCSCHIWQCWSGNATNVNAECFFCSWNQYLGPDHPNSG